MIVLKPPTTYEQQVEMLRVRGCLIEDTSFCIEVLSQINYYRLSAYLLPFKKDDGNYLHRTNFKDIYQIYEFDRKLRNMLFSAVEEVEIHLRAKFAYYHAHKYGVTGYLDAANYNERHRHDVFMEKIENEIKNNRKALFVQHHIDSYDGVFPIWVITELFTFGMLSYFYGDMPLQDQKQLAKEIFCTTPKNIVSWLRCCTDLRNICAHYGRLYFRIFSAVPANIPCLGAKSERRLFGVVLALKALYPNADKWNTRICVKLKKLITSYHHIIKLSHIGFPTDWEGLLRN
ncbi:MAG: Abi family protein [Treponema sp.]|nr:Abi family protein [Treponema sp.]